MTRLGQGHGENLKKFQEALISFFAQDRPYLLLGAGGCQNCEQCTCPDLPCRFPDKMIISMEAMGIFVSELCKLNDIPYYYGPNTLAYVACVLL
jgi:predicted metal-binding protein